MAQSISLADKERLFGKVVYIYFCFYSMAVAQLYGMNIVYGAAIYISLAAIIRMLRFIIKTTYDLLWLKVIKLVLAVFLCLVTVYIFVLYPFLYTYPKTVYAIFIIIMPFLAREAENALLFRYTALERKGVLLVLLGSAAICLALSAGLVWLSGVNAFVIIPAAVVGIGLAFYRQWTFKDYALEYPQHDIQPPDLRQIRSARLYDGMVITSGVALNIFMFTYVLYLMFMRRISLFTDFFVMFGFIAVVSGVIYLAAYRFARRSLIQTIGKNAAFVMGTGIAIFAVYVFRDSWYKGTLSISIQTLLLLFGLMLQMIASLGMREDILLVTKLQNKDVEEAALEKRTQRLEHWIANISETIVLGVLAVLISDPFIYAMDFDQYIMFAPQIGASLVAIPTVFLLASLVYAIKQPLTAKYNRRLKVYLSGREEGIENAVMEKRLKNVLIKTYKKRIGVHVIRMLLKPVMYHSVVGRENVTALPGIFVFNHREVYGPIAAVVFLPYDMRPWILDKMIDKEQITAHMYEGTFSRIKWLPVFARKGLTKILSPLVIWALSSFDPIPVYRGTAKSVLRTFELSIECLQSGDSILLFPENPQERYTDSQQINDFYRGFANLGRLYYRKTKECVTFYPVYASKVGRQLRIGEGVTYDPSYGRQEAGRIVEALQTRMRFLQSLDDEENG